MSDLPPWLEQLLPIIILLVAIAFVLWRVPKVDIGHSPAFKKRRLLNWFPLGLTYAFLYFGRYNLSANANELAQYGLATKTEFGQIDGIASFVYGFAFLLNGPLTDRWGGRVTILLAAGGSALMNLALAVVTWAAMNGRLSDHGDVVTLITVLYSANMYFQSFGAVSIVKVNAPWFHVRERGLLGGVFGILISLGLYFAYDWSRLIAKALPSADFYAVFAVPALVLVAFLIIDAFVIRDSPVAAGFAEFDTGDASSGETGPRLPVLDVLKKMLSNRVILIIIAVEFCSGFLRNAVMKWYLIYAKGIGFSDGFVSKNWGMLLCVAGILGAMFAGLISDYVFDSRRGPVASVLYGGIVAGSLATLAMLGMAPLGWVVVFMSLCVIGVHGMLSGTASMDFGGKRNAGVATGIIDGFVYLGTGVQSILYGIILPSGEAAKVASNWNTWPLAMIPVAIAGLILATRVWNARPQKQGAPSH